LAAAREDGLKARLPDCRLAARRDRTVRLRMRRLGASEMERVFCANCGCDGGLVTADWAWHVFYLCEPCAEKHGRLDLAEIPESLVRPQQTIE
jgi:hypothetical protein